ncbi:MAG TPA: NAD(P)/FAD-dependent oxidoreductase [Chryseolinea sp.]|nr:NAD(P)/FAD-dependent oxidoreductase [Chryseolinea sp.]
MTEHNKFDVIIVGGSYSGLAAAMALGRALRKVLIIDSGNPCNAQTPHSHNFLTQDGKTPKEISSIAKQQVERYSTVKFFNGIAQKGNKTVKGFDIQVESGETFASRKLIFATGIRDIMPPIEGSSECWGVSLLHCPYCHGYEVRNKKTGILANGDSGFEFSILISNWTNDLTLYTNGTSTLSEEQTTKLKNHNIKIVEKVLAQFDHANGQIQNIVFKDGSKTSLDVMYSRASFEQHCKLPEILGCEITEEAYVKIDGFQKTTIAGIFAVGDNTSRMRTIANAVAMGTTAGTVVNKEICLEDF